MYRAPKQQSLRLLSLSLSLSLVLWAGVVEAPRAQVSGTTLCTAQNDYALCADSACTVCPAQDYALCAASTCTATGGTIQGPRGVGTFPEASCLCPILHGQALAALNCGNMQASCEPPPGGVWSLFPSKKRRYLPQQITNWQPAQYPEQDCPSSKDGAAVYFALCFSYACEDAGKINGVRVARCYCPMETTDEGDFATQAGQCDQNVCDEIPEGKEQPTAILQGKKCEK